MIARVSLSLFALAGALTAASAPRRRGGRRCGCCRTTSTTARGPTASSTWPRIAGVIKAAKPDLVAAAGGGPEHEAHEAGRSDGGAGQADRAERRVRQGDRPPGRRVRAGGPVPVPLRAGEGPQLPGKEEQEARIVMRGDGRAGRRLPPLTFLNTHLQHDDGEIRGRSRPRRSTSCSARPTGRSSWPAT